MLCCIPLFESGREYIPSFRVETQSSYAYRSLSESLLAYLITFSTPRTLWLAEAALCNAEAAMCYFSTLIIAVLYISALCTAHIIVVRHQYKVHLKAIRYED